MLRSYKVEIKPTKEQIVKINQTIGVCRYVHNLYLAENIKSYKDGNKFITAFTFSKWLNNEYVVNNQDKLWIKEVSSKSVKQAIVNAEKAFKNFFKKSAKFPRFKKKKHNNMSMYFVKNNKNDCICQRHRLKIPTLGFVRLKQKGYIPTNKIIKSGYVTKIANRYFVSVLIDTDVPVNNNPFTDGIGIDLGIENFAILSNGTTFPNINKSNHVRKLEKMLIREQKRLSKKFEFIKKGVATSYKNINKKKLRIQKLHYRLTCVRNDYINKIVSNIVKTKPCYITIEDLNVTQMLSNKHLAKFIQKQKFYYFKEKLIYKAKLNNIEIRLADRYYPSSKICSNCNNIKRNLKLNERTYVCNNCKTVINRDLNASINLLNCNNYTVA